MPGACLYFIQKGIAQALHNRKLSGGRKVLLYHGRLSDERTLSRVGLQQCHHRRGVLQGCTKTYAWILMTLYSLQMFIASSDFYHKSIDNLMLKSEFLMYNRPTVILPKWVSFCLAKYFNLRSRSLGKRFRLPFWGFTIMEAYKVGTGCCWNLGLHMNLQLSFRTFRTFAWIVFSFSLQMTTTHNYSIARARVVIQ